MTPSPPAPFPKGSGVLDDRLELSWLDRELVDHVGDSEVKELRLSEDRPDSEFPDIRLRGGGEGGPLLLLLLLLSLPSSDTSSSTSVSDANETSDVELAVGDAARLLVIAFCWLRS